MATFAELEREADELVRSAGLAGRVGAREHLLASMAFHAGLNDSVHCPACRSVIQVEEFPQRNGLTITCPCGVCSGTMKGF
ncbi:hypothetical protein [Alienimonas sp. DA493]|uniref:hypothetical protein n=1 Tax=Alienimonas sp. DA493 TaxID=3373605 RepID=UPI00375430A9